MKIELDYVKVGDYYLPDLTAEPYPDRGLDKYGLLRLRYLKELGKRRLSISQKPPL